MKEKIANLSVAVENIALIIDLASTMLGNAIFGSVADDPAKQEMTITQIIALLDVLSEKARTTSAQCDELERLSLKTLTVA